MQRQNRQQKLAIKTLDFAIPVVNYISCDARTLYRAGGFCDDAALLDAMAQRSPSSRIQILGEIYPPFSYSRAMPEILHATESFRDDLLAQYRSINAGKSQGAASVLAEISQAVVCSNVLYVQEDDARQIVYETHREPDRSYVSLLDREAAEPYPVKPDALYFYLGSAGSFNYGHWLVDDLPRLHAFSLLRAAYPRQHIAILLPTYSHEWSHRRARRWNKARIESIRLFLRDERNYSVSFVELLRAYSFTKLFYATPISLHPVLKSPEAAALVTQKLVSKPGWRQLWRSAPSRLFIARKTKHGRRLTNSDTLSRLLKQRGFVAVDPENMSVSRQAMVFGSADMVVGTMGAAMTNTIFCRPGTRIVHLAPEGWMEPFYWDLAALRGHHYCACYGPTEPTPGPAHMTSFRIDEDSLRVILG